MQIQGQLLLDPRVAPRPGWIEVEDGRIVAIGEGDPPGPADAGGPDRLITPGFIDAHLHLPQIDAIGCDGLELLEWLDRVIYPAEAAWADPRTAARQVGEAYRRLLRSGTLGWAGYLTSHREGVVAVVRAAHQLPLRALAGQVLMDRSAPAALLGQPQARLNRSERGRMEASLNPRFAVACSDELLAAAAARIAPGVCIQTHLSETRSECDLVRRLFPDDPHYTGVYDRHGLLTERTLLAHGVHLSDAEWALIAARRSVVVHCPGANTFLRAGLFDLRAAMEHGVRLALGSDVAAGPDLAMPRIARAMVEVAKLRRLTLDPRAPVPTPAEAWRAITRGNAEALGWPDGGRIEVGAAADLLILRLPFEPDEHLIGRLIYTWRDSYIERRIVAGHLH